jgi:hypothetical protein
VTPRKRDSRPSIALAKFERLARAVDIILAALALLLVAAVLTTVGP